MAFSGNFMCTSFKKELMEGGHNFKNSGGDTFKIALYTDSASFTAATTEYTSSNEITGTNYSAKGNTLVNVDPTTSSTTAYTDFTDTSWSTATFSAMGAMIFNEDHTSPADSSVVILDFGALKTATAGTFTIAFPAADASNAIIRIA
jgi:hypothetical protein